MSIENLQSTLTFTNLCELLQNEMLPSISLVDNNGKKRILKIDYPEIVGLILGFKMDYILPIMIDHADFFGDFRESLLKYKGGKIQIPVEVQNAYSDESKEIELNKYIKETFIDNMKDSKVFMEKLHELIKNDPSNSWNTSLSEEKDVTLLLIKALCAVMDSRIYKQKIKQENKKKKETALLTIMQENEKNSKETSPTHSIAIIIGGVEFQDNIIFRNIEDAISYCTKNNYLINYLLSLSSITYIVYVQKSDYKIHKLTSEEFPMALDLLELYKDEFRPKSFWPEYNIFKLCKEGLDSGIWTAYGCFDGDRLIGYIDYKITCTSGIEIGTELVDPQYRERSIATALINLIRLQYAFLPTFSGTYEENANMRKTFDAAGYTIDNSKGCNGLVKERIDIAHPNNDEFTTNSIYYIAKPFLSGYARQQNKSETFNN